MSDDRPEVQEQSEEGKPLESEAPLKDYSAKAEPVPVAGNTDQIVERWFDDHIRGSIVGQNTPIWNHIMVCKDKLKEELRKFL